MCGIYLTSKNFNDNLVLKKMKSISYRGPDNSTIIKKNNIILGHNRLSIIDLEKRSDQPFMYQNSLIVFNGEIYNYKILKKELIKKNYIFKTNSDTEVLLAMYCEYGYNCLKYLNGMFSFAIYDISNQVVFFARDRMGQKPLYYKLDNNQIEISSQIKQIEIGNNLTISNEASTSFFRYKYIPEPLSIYNEVFKLPAGNYGLFDLKNFKFTINKYWDLKKIKTVNYNYNEAKDRLDYLINSSVKYRLISDVNLGVNLSGGVDSSLITAIAQNQSVKKLNTFCVKFDDNLFDESIYAKKIAKYLNTNHTTINCENKNIYNLIYSYNDCFDEPFADSSALPSLLLNKVIKNHVTVTLSGDGGDESFLGYNRYDYISKYSLLFKFPHSLRKIISYLLSNIEFSKTKELSSLISEKNFASFYKRIIQTINQSYINDNINNNYFDHSYLLNYSDDIYKNISLFDLKTYLPDDINVKIDRSSMFSSVELRSPFLDYRIVEFALSLPTNFKYKKGKKKIILKDILNKYLPQHLYDRPKSGFTFPLSRYLKKDLKELSLDLLTDKNLKSIPIINYEETKLMIEDFYKNKSNKQNEIWKLLVYIMWLNKNM